MAVRQQSLDAVQQIAERSGWTRPRRSAATWCGHRFPNVWPSLAALSTIGRIGGWASGPPNELCAAAKVG
jgi:hypothetical protein